MLEKYDINDLFFATIRVKHPRFKISNGRILLLKKIPDFTYTSIVYKMGDEYIDLSKKSKKINEESPAPCSYIIEKLEPLSKYYKQRRIK